MRRYRRFPAEFERKKSDWRNYGAAAVIGSICLIVGMLTIGMSVFAEQKIDGSIGIDPLDGGERYVPNISGMSYEQAQEVLKQNHLKAELTDMNYSDSIEKDRILSQTPKAGNVAAEGDTIHIVVSGGTEEVTTPDFTGMTCEEAEELAAAQHLLIQAEKREKYSDRVKKGDIMTQSVVPKKRTAVQTEITLTVSLGSLSEETALLTVPDFRGITKERAITRLGKIKAKEGFTYSIGDIEEKYSSEVKKGDIISQSPKQDTKARTNEPLHLVISRGPQMIPAPKLTNLTEEKALKELKKAGFSADVETEYSSQVSEGMVIRQGTKAGAKAAKGSSIKIVISLGAQPVQNTQNVNDNNPSRGSGGTGGSSGGSRQSTGSVSNPGSDSKNQKEQPQSDGGNTDSHETENGQQEGNGSFVRMSDGTGFMVE